MFDVTFSSQAAKFLRKADKQLAQRLVDKIEKLQNDPFPQDIKRVVNRTEKIFRIRAGAYHIQYNVLFEKNTVFISDIDKRPRAYD